MDKSRIWAALVLFGKFNIVGLLATGSYFVAGMALAYALTLSALSVHLIAFAVSLAVSYCGHTWFTFGVSGTRYLMRFAIVTGLLFVASTGLTVGLARIFALPNTWLVVIVTVTYPVLSFVIHSLWTFKKPATPAQAER